MSLTAIIICRSKQGADFKRAFNSVKFADEILAVERREIKDYAAVRNEALQKAKGEWVMFVDSDEEVSEELAKEMISKINKTNRQTDKQVVGYRMKRADRFLGKWLKYGETAGVNLLRLAGKGTGRWRRPVHEVWEVGGKILQLKNPIRHYSHDSVDGMVEKLDRYSQIEAGYRQKKIVKLLNCYIVRLLIVCRMVVFPAGKFVLNYFLRLGFLDGMEGWIHAVMMSGHSFLVRAKLLEGYEYTKSYE